LVVLSREQAPRGLVEALEDHGVIDDDDDDDGDDDGLK
jgi:hypothetical protein